MDRKQLGYPSQHRRSRLVACGVVVLAGLVLAGGANVRADHTAVDGAVADPTFVEAAPVDPAPVNPVRPLFAQEQLDAMDGGTDCGVLGAVSLPFALALLGAMGWRSGDTGRRPVGGPPTRRVTAVPNRVRPSISRSDPAPPHRREPR